MLYCLILFCHDFCYASLQKFMPKLLICYLFFLGMNPKAINVDSYEVVFYE